METPSEKLEFFRRLGGQALVDDIHATARQFQQADQRFMTPNADASTKWRIPGAVESVQLTEEGIRLKCEQGWLDLRWLAPNCLHLRFASSPNDFDSYFSYAIHKQHWTTVSLEIKEERDQILVATSAYVYRITTRPFGLTVETIKGRVICRDSPGIQKNERGAVRLTMRLRPEEACYGMGERAAGLNLRGAQYQLWNTDPPNPYQRGTDPLYYSIPFCLNIHDDGAYGVLWDNSHRGHADFGQETPDEFSFEAEAGGLSYYLFAGADMNVVLSRYTELTGRIMLPPLWFLGYQQCRWSYFPQDEVLKIAGGFRQRGIPCDVIYLDIHYMQGYRDFIWDHERFPDPAQLIQTLHESGFHVVVILDPGIKIDPAYTTYQSGIESGVFLRYPDDEHLAAAVWPGLCHFPDFTHAAARQWWAQQCQPLLNMGIDGLWNDMCEPAVFLPDGPGTLPDYVPHEQEGRGGSHREIHNVYGMQMARASFEALQQHKPADRPVNMLRAGYAGAQRYAASWTGDNTASWDHLRLSISMALNMGLSGAPMTGPDIGGFFGNADGELFTRWLQATCLMPYFRGHSALDTAPHEPWVFDQPYEVINRVTIQLRYNLMPYLYSIVAQAAEYGWPVIRPLFSIEPQNPALRSIDDCYLLGDALLVAPIVEKGALKRDVYLPDTGDWYDYWTNERLAGGRKIEVTAPLERLPLFVRAGSVIPTWPDMQYVNEKPLETMTMRCYPGNHETVIYEDAGEGLGYQQGHYRWVYITVTEDHDKLTINRRVAGKFTPAYAATNIEIIAITDEPDAIRIDRRGAPLWFYDDGLLEVKADSFQSVEIDRKPTSSDPTLPKPPW
ncbi:MAG: hypothetical protein CL610_09400 [Anaerolineaceae bacterium]|nr:hypothetical protein [Anaerolineaceae bacterium]